MTTEKTTGRKRSVYYIDNKKFYAEMKKYIDACKEAKAEGKEVPIVPNYIADCFIKIATKLSTKHQFIGYTYRQDMISDAIENCIRYVKSFNPEKTDNPFAYFTQFAKNSFLHRINKERQEQYIKAKSMDNMLLTGMMDSDMISGTVALPEMYENQQQLIVDYEKYVAEKRLKNKKPPVSEVPNE